MTQMRMSIQDWDPTALQPLRRLVVDDDDAVRDVLMQQRLLDGHFTETAPVAMSMLLWANRWRAINCARRSFKPVIRYFRQKSIT